MDRKTTGNRGEEIARHFYESRGCEILEMNFRFKRAEIDIIVLENEKRLVFVEVKTRTRKDYGEPEMFVSRSQQKRIKEAAEEYIFGINWHKEIRFDIVSVDSTGNVEHFEDAF